MIVEAATRLLASEGRILTTNRVAERAGVSIGSIYQYFGGKQAILNEIARRHLRSGEDAINEVLAHNPVGARPWPDVLYDLVAVTVSQNRSHGPAHGRLRHLVMSHTLAEEYEALL
ncbi:TetR/AcrR family transcriptional regulator [Gordonia liuliyuniae]|uniref:TetR/AcrR family transcriptional regulator n=1 Tax=Gordonia liuliyuniae TaxID=2911517 RepID=A0ABS9IWD3_9ACTN|nr:TetR/AcrR family transcriptional regulator [Gordonia liuliyuniae]MCF8589866.1 TetR/AcrR family transcriptional regulator [Gordonia liuliyuniae]